MRSYIWTRASNEESCPKPSVAPAWCFPVISTAKGRKMWWSSACIICLLNCYCSSKLCLSYTTPSFTCQNGGGIWLASRSSLSNKGTVDWISGQQKATLGTMTRYSLCDCVDEGGAWLFCLSSVCAAPISINASCVQALRACQTSDKQQLFIQHTWAKRGHKTRSHLLQAPDNYLNIESNPGVLYNKMT